MKSKLFILIFIYFLFGASGVFAEEYKITPGDELEVFIWDNPDLTRQLEVKMDGSIAMPLIGKVKAEGLTAKELEEKLVSEFLEYLKKPGISVIISRHSQWVVSVFGEVRRQSGREVPFYEGMGLLELIARTGGVTKDAKTKKCVVLREVKDESRKKIEVNLDAILNGEAPDFKLQVGDVVYIPHTRLTSWNYFVDNVMPTLSFIATLATMSAILF
ncbi:MAG: polysaccharide biosynthesis/export family protein [Elusimicrobiota bacterium]